MNAAPLVAALGCAALLGAGCVGNDVSVAISNFIPADTASSMAGTCLYDPSSTVTTTAGVYDVVLGALYGTGYQAAFVTQNNLEKRPNVDVELQAYYVQGYNVQLDVFGPVQPFLPDALDREFKVETATTRIAPGDKVAGSATIIKAHKLDMLADIDFDKDPKNPAEVVAHIAPIVTRAEEQQVAAAANFPVRICRGCLIDGGTSQFCSSFPKGAEVRPGNACNPAADEAITCCRTGDATNPGALVCGAAAKNFIPM